MSRTIIELDVSQGLRKGLQEVADYRGMQLSEVIRSFVRMGLAAHEVDKHGGQILFRESCNDGKTTLEIPVQLFHT